MTGHCIRVDDDKDPRHKTFWIPERCEVASCSTRTDLKTCSQCNMVMYCSKECQKKDWERHKVECAHLASLGMIGKPYPIPYNSFHCPGAKLDEMYRAKHPPKEQKQATCEICGRSVAQCRIQLSPCCGMKQCNREDQYVNLSFSRNFCSRSHRLYTMCYAHIEDGHVGQDWRDCHDCKLRLNIDTWMLFAAMNAYNPRPPRPHHKGLLFTNECMDCKKRIYIGLESIFWGDRGGRCQECSGHEVTEYPRQFHKRIGKGASSYRDTIYKSDMHGPENYKEPDYSDLPELLDGAGDP